MLEDERFSIARGAADDGMAQFCEVDLAGGFAGAALAPCGPCRLNGLASERVGAARGVVGVGNQRRRGLADEVGFDDVEVAAQEIVVVFQRARAGAQGVEVVAQLVGDGVADDAPAFGQPVELGSREGALLRGGGMASTG